jgi:hypothetical protein
MSDAKRSLMRHFLATLAYRARKAIAGAPVDFAFFAGAGKTPSAILSHMGDLMAWSISWFGEPRWKAAEVGPWDTNVSRFFTLLKELDLLLASHAPLRCYNEERMMQGPLADAMTHVGQLAMLRRMAGAATPAENFAEAPVAIGDVSGPASARAV